MKIGIVGAMQQEVELLRDKMQQVVREQVGTCIIYQGKIDGIDVALLQSGIGKSAAAMGTTALLMLAKPDVIINTGSAGGVAHNLTVGDLIISDEVAYHDADVTAFGYEKGQLPANPTRFQSDKKLIEVVENVLLSQKQKSVHGLICTGDLFCNGEEQIAAIKKDFSDVVAIEMEAAAIAQVCHAFNVPFVVVRAVSDVADQDSALSFEEFLPIAAKQSSEMIIKMLPLL